MKHQGNSNEIAYNDRSNGGEKKQAMELKQEQHQDEDGNEELGQLLLSLLSSLIAHPSFAIDIVIVLLNLLPLPSTNADSNNKESLFSTVPFVHDV
mmetsp:Transcript_22465/g.48690  ORF Transcript_22465/g.48690 Transcript_22465/m.48690 type:complete len:96 (+) Transcript_22465:409-696(+)